MFYKLKVKYRDDQTEIPCCTHNKVWLGVYTNIIKKGVKKDLWSKKEKQGSLSVCSSHKAMQGFVVVFI